MAKPRKPDSRRPSKKKLEKKKKIKNVEDIIQKMYENLRYTYPTENSKKGIEECLQRVKEGKACYCKENCKCRNCLERSCTTCFFEKGIDEEECALGCSECPECNQCY